MRAVEAHKPVSTARFLSAQRSRPARRPSRVRVRTPRAVGSTQYAQLLLDTCPASCCVGAPATRASCPTAGPVSQRVPDVSAAETGSVRGPGKSYRRVAAEALRILKQVSVSLP